MKAVLFTITLYWTALLAVSLLPMSSWASREHVFVVLLVAGVPVFVLAGARLWHVARMGLSSSDLAYRDELTGLPNRRAFLGRTQELLTRARISRLALLLLDVDGLKAINDECGHQAGDELLVRAAEKLAKAPGNAFRIGGDEFAVVIDRRKGEAVMSAIKQLEPFTAVFTACSHEHRVRMSYGCASNHEDDTFETLFSRADSRLRQLKATIYSSGEVDDHRGFPESLPSDIASISRRRNNEERRLSAVN